ncbi:MAG: heat-inducible transcriptional repressor HrcA [Simkaniaceae bacterium]|nr:heat-inducible transcriptional repressor HrcA [Simkaniaceae bacterium]
MPHHKTTSRSKPTKNERERAVLLSLVELYIQTGIPVGSNTLKDYRFSELSSATIRNYFASLEEEGYLIQHHTSGGRLPSERAYQLYAHTYKGAKELSQEDTLFLKSILERNVREISSYLQQGLEALSELTGCACFMLAPRFDQDFINQIKLLSLDNNRLLCVLITEFGFVHTETIYSPQKLSHFSLKRIEDYFRIRLTQSNETPDLSKEEAIFANQIYNEALLRHIITYNNFDREDIYKSGFSKLLNQREFKDINTLSSSLSLFESSAFIRSLLNDCFRSNGLKFWIGSQLEPYVRSGGTALVAMPYYLHHNAVGAVAILGAERMDYPHIFATLKTFSKMISQSLTKTLYKFKISYRNPHPNHFEITSGSNQMLIEQRPSCNLPDSEES